MSLSSNKIGRPTIRKHEKRSRVVVFRMNDIEHKKYESLVLSLSSSSPALTASDFFRLIVENIDTEDQALFRWLGIEILDPLQGTLIKTKRDYNKKQNDS